MGETGWLCGGYASTEWESTLSNTKGKDEDAFLFVIRPADKRKVFHRQRNCDGEVVEPEGGILFNRGDGFNFGYNTLFWGNANQSEERIREIWADTGYFTHESPNALIGQK